MASRSRSPGGYGGDGRGSRDRLAWGGNALRGSSASGGAGSDSRDGAFSRSGDQRQHSNSRVGDRVAGGGGGRGGSARGGNDDGGGSYGRGWSERKRSLESFDGQDGQLGSPKKVMHHRRDSVDNPQQQSSRCHSPCP